MKWFIIVIIVLFMWISYYSSGINAAAEFVPCALRCRFHPGCGLGQGGVMENKLYLVIPCYNEEEVLLETAGRLREDGQLNQPK